MPARSSRDVARRALVRVERDKKFASEVLDQEIEAAGLSPRDRALATELTYGVLRYRSRLDRALAAYAERGIGRARPKVMTALRLAAYQILFLDRVPDHAAVNDATEALRNRGRAVSGFVNGLLRSLVRGGEPQLPDEHDQPIEAAASMHAMPAQLMAELAKSVDSSDLMRACAGLNARPPIWLRANPLQCTPEELQKALEAEGVSSEVHACGAVRVQAMGSPSGTSAFERGAYSVQDLAAQWVGLLADPEAGTRILDACAGVGGKTTHLVELTRGDAEIHAVDRSDAKLDKLRESAGRLQLGGAIRPLRLDLETEDAGLLEQYDLVVIDAPCTGLGVMRRHPEIKWREGASDSRELERVQATLLSRLAPRVRAGGSLVYAVCSFKEEEGPAQIERFLAEHSDFTVDATSTVVPLARDPKGYLRSWPHLDDADAFFAVRLRRS